MLVVAEESGYCELSVAQLVRFFAVEPSYPGSSPRRHRWSLFHGFVPGFLAMFFQTAYLLTTRRL
jgi:hypothetical protein